MDVGIVASSQDLVCVKLKTRNHVALVRTKRDMLRPGIFIHPALPDKVVPLI
jgi:hypothetical protein